MASNLVMEQRSEFMVSPTAGDNEHVKTSYFLTPSITGPVAAPSLHSSPKSKDLPNFKVNFHGWTSPKHQNWKTWVHKMHTLHHSTWKKSGIYDAIMNSTFTIHRHGDLIFGLVQKWCPKTNTFVFPWGEATVTLEDTMVLGGYSVLGNSVFCPPGNEEMKEIVDELLVARSEISSSKAKKACQGMWMSRFMDSGNEIEHEAFLAYWLSKFVFPFWRDAIGRDVISIAVHLARGTKIALAPAILACIYQSLSSLKTRIISARESGGKKNQKNDIKASSPLALVQVWVWERFPGLGPTPNSVAQSEPRLARWHNLNKMEIRDFSLEIESFQWRPYNSTCLSKLYMDNGYWTRVESNCNEELEGVVRCLRTSELVGLEKDCIEQYLPHRVSMQFGMDQDLPGYVERVNGDVEIAWRNYIRPVRDVRIYLPGLLYKPGVTTRYFKWWKNLSEHSFVPPPPGFSPESKFSPGEISPSISSAGKGDQSLKRKLVLRSLSDDEAWDDNARVFSPGILGSEKVMVEVSSSESNGNSHSTQTELEIKGEILSSTKNIGNIEKATLSVKAVEFEQVSEGWIDMNNDDVRSSSSKTERAGLGLEERLRNIEKLCSLLESGRLKIPTEKTNRKTK